MRQIRSILATGLLLASLPVYLLGLVLGLCVTFFIVGWRQGQRTLPMWLSKAL